MPRPPFLVSFTVTVRIDPAAWQKEYGDVNPSAAVEGITHDLYSAYKGQPAAECGAVKILVVAHGSEVTVSDD